MPIQYAEGAVSWNGFLKQVGFNPPSVYEVSAVSVIPAGQEDGNEVQLRCSEGDWFLHDGQNDNRLGVILSTGDTSLGSLIDIRPRGSLVKEFEFNVSVDFRKTIGFNGFAQANNNALPSNTPITITGLCWSPSSMMTVGGEWQATDTTALIIGYSVLNAYWIAPMAIGIGLGIYLVKRKF